MREATTPISNMLLTPFLWLAFGLSTSGHQAAPHPELKSSIPLAEMLDRMAGLSATYRYRMVQLGPGGHESVERLEDGIVFLEYKPSGILMAKEYWEETSKDPSKVLRRQIRWYSALSREVTMSAERFGGIGTKCYLDYWSELPPMVHYAAGACPPGPIGGETSDAWSTTDGVVRCETTAQGVEDVRLIHAFEDGALVRRVFEGRDIGRARVEFERYEGAPADGTLPDVIFAEEMNAEKELTALISVRVEPAAGAVPEPLLPVGSFVSDMRASGAVRSWRTDRPLPLSALANWPRPVGEQMVASAAPDFGGSPRADEGLGLGVWLVFVASLGAWLLLRRHTAHRLQATCLLGTFLPGAAEDPWEELRRSSLAALRVHEAPLPRACTGDDGRHRFSLRQSWDGSHWREFGLPVAGGAPLYSFGGLGWAFDTLATEDRCGHCGLEAPSPAATTSARRAGARLMEAPVRFSMDSDEGAAVAEGIVRLESDDAEGIVVHSTGGCGVACTTDLPAPFSQAALPLRYFWDTHNPSLPQDNSMVVGLASGEVLALPMALDWDDHLFRLDREVLAFSSAGDSATLTVESPLGLIRNVALHGLPPCLSVMGAGSRPLLADLRLRENDVAGQSHACSAVTLFVYLEGDEVGFERRVRVDHSWRAWSRGAALPLHGRFFPGERIWIALTDDALSIACPDRFSAGMPVLFGDGFSIVAEESAPLEEGPFVLSDAAGEWTLRGEVDSGLLARMGDWSSPDG